MSSVRLGSSTHAHPTCQDFLYGYRCSRRCSCQVLLDNGGFVIRAVTRSPNGAVAEGLAERGAQIFRADLNDVKILQAAVSGSYAVFAVTAIMCVLI